MVILGDGKRKYLCKDEMSGGLTAGLCKPL